MSKGLVLFISVLLTAVVTIVVLQFLSSQPKVTNYKVVTFNNKKYILKVATGESFVGPMWYEVDSGKVADRETGIKLNELL